MLGLISFSQEGFENTDERKTVVDFNGKVQEAYDAIFGRNNTQVTEVEKCSFSSRTKEKILASTDILSEKANY